MWSTLPIRHLVRRLARIAPLDLKDRATRSWEIAPGEISIRPKAYFLPNQLERVTGWSRLAGTRVEQTRSVCGGEPVEHAATRGLLLHDAFLIDGVLYQEDACSHLQPRSHRWPQTRVEREIERGAVYCTPGGNRYFAQWLMDDCVTYALASAEGIPVTTNQAVGAHTPGYEEWLDMHPCRVQSAHFRELVIFEDFGQNRDKHARFRTLGEKLSSHVPVQPYPGVFIIRGQTGQSRLLTNEWEIAGRLRENRGFRILDPIKADVPSVVECCAGARVVVGVEGSGLIHGILLLPPGGAVLTLQPPGQFSAIYKDLTDRDHQHFGFVVGHPEGQGFRIDCGEVERTLDLLPS